MLTVREQIAMGIFDAFKEDISDKDPVIENTEKTPRMTITTNGYLDYEVSIGEEYLEKDCARAIRMDKSDRARKNRRELRRLKTGDSCR